MVFIPEGTHTITPSVNGKAKEITVRVSPKDGENIAQRIQASLESRNQKNKVRAIFDFDHKDTGPAAALPQRFFYEAGKGIMVERELTGAGSKAIKAKDYSYFSPVFLINKQGIPSGLPDKGPLGALVNDPAFRDIERIAAKQAETTKPETMNELVKCGLLTEDESAKTNAGEIASKRVSAMTADNDKVTELNKQIEALEAEKKALGETVEASNKVILDAKEANADSLIVAAVADGRISAKDEDSKTFWKDSILSNESAVKALSALPKKNEGITKPIVQAGNGSQAKEDELTGLDAVEASLAKEIENSN